MCHFLSVVLHHLHAPVFTFFAAAAAASVSMRECVCMRALARARQCEYSRIALNATGQAKAQKSGTIPREQ